MKNGPGYMLAGILGMAIAGADLEVNDLLLTALLVLASAMLLGILQPRAPWRWVLALMISIPAAELLAYGLLTVKPSLGQIYALLLTALPGMAGAYGGSFLRKVFDNLSQGK